MTPLVSSDLTRRERELIIRILPSTTSTNDDTDILNSVLLVVNKATSNHRVPVCLACCSNKGNLVLLTVPLINAATTIKVEFLLTTAFASLDVSQCAI